MKTSLLILIVMLCVLWSIASPASKTYWENVGPAWEKMLKQEGNDDL